MLSVSLGYSRFVFSLLLFLVWTCAAAASGATFDLAVLEDAEGRETIDRIAAAAPDRFRPLPSRGLAKGHTHSVHWLRLTIDAPVGEWWLDVLPGYLDDLRLYEAAPDKPASFIERRAGDRLDFGRREVPYRGFVFKIRKDDPAPKTLWLRLQTTSTSLLIPRLWTPDEFHANAQFEYGLLLGIVLAVFLLFLLNLGNGYWLHIPLLLWFALYLLSLMVTFLATGGFINQYVTPSSPHVGDATTGIATIVSIALSTPFQRHLFMVDRRRKIFFAFYRFMFWASVAVFVATAMGFFVEAMALLIKLVAIMSLVGMWLSFRLWRNGVAGGGLLFVANLIAQFGVLSLMLNLMGIWYTPFIQIYGMQISMLGSVAAIHMSIGARLRDDLSKARSSEEAVRQASAEARNERQLRLQQTEFFAMLTHELKTPLAMIDGSVQSLNLLVPHDPDVLRRHDRIRRAVGRINNLVQKFLYQHHLDGASPPLRREPVCLDILLNRILDNTVGVPDRISLDAAEEIWITGDDNLLNVMIVNLIDNALKYSPDGTRIEISLRRDRTADTAILDVRDYGPGIQEEIKDRIFERYVRGSNLGDIPGAGLGLYLVKGIASLHGGGVELVDMRQHPGACFRITLPIGEQTS